MKNLTGIFSPWGKFYSPLLGSLGGGGSQDDNPERRRKVTVIAVLVIVASLVSLFFTMCEHTPKVNRAPFIGLGQVLADETATAIDNHGTVVPVIADYHATGSTPMADEWNTFAKAIKKHSGVTLAAPVIVKLDESMGEPGISRADFDKIIEKNANAAVIVLLVGMPMLDAKHPLTLPHTAPKIVAVHNTSMPAKQYLANSIVTVLITSRMTPEENAAAVPKTPRQWFDKYFQIFTDQNYQSMPD